MPIKNTPPAIPEPKPAQQMTEERFMRVNPDVDKRLDQFIQGNPKMMDYYSSLVKEKPERAIRAFMLNKMFKHEAQVKITEQQAPQAKEWLEKQDPTLRERIAERLQKINPFYREKALVTEIAKEKTRLDFTPPKQSKGISI